jgi:hypothetical protein
MTLESSAFELVHVLKAARESTADLLRLITEDRPYEHSLAHRFEHSTSDILGRLDAAVNAALVLEQVAVQYDHTQALGALATCQTEFNLAAEKFHSEPKSFDWLQDLYALGNDHPDEWMGWTTSIKATLDQCNLLASQDPLLKCWQSLVVSSGAISNRHI